MKRRILLITLVLISISTLRACRETVGSTAARNDATYSVDPYTGHMTDTQYKQYLSEGKDFL